MEHHIICVGLDVYKDTIAVGRRGRANGGSGLRENFKYAGGVEGAVGQAGSKRRQAAVLLRSRSLRLWHPAPVERCRTRMRGGGAFVGSPHDLFKIAR